MPGAHDAIEARPSDVSAAILVIDDNSAKRLVINSVLEPLGHAIVEAESGEAGLRAVMERTFAVILMDVQMPVMNGYETAQLIRMRADSEHTPIIFITAHARDEAQNSIAYASGAVDFIFGPIVADTLRAKVSIFVELFLKSRQLEDSLSDVTVLGEQFRDSEARTRAVLDNVADGIVTVDHQGMIESFNRAATDLFGYSEREAIGQPFSIMVPIDGAGALTGCESAEPSLVDRRTGRHASESVGRRKDGSTFPVEMALSDVQLGTREVHIGCLRDISERREHIATLEHQAMHDNLTGLPNRVLFKDRVEHAISAATRSDTPLALFVLDLDGFKHINDTLGHRHGDILLSVVGERLVGCLRDGDTVARLGGDEFGVLPLGPTDLAGAASVAWKIQQALTPPIVIEDQALDVQTSIGIALFPDQGDNIEDLLRRADLAMYQAKRTGAGYKVFAAEQEDAPARRLALLGALRSCIEHEELVLHYQPKIDLTTRETIGVEALIRWNHPSGRLFRPDEFMPEVERSNLMMPITQWVLEEAVGQLQTWREQGYDLSMAVNIGARCLATRARLFETVDEIIEHNAIPPDKLTLELTEVSLIDTGVPGLMERLQAMDERLSIDDFGTGYSSLAYLQRLPVFEIKADRSFVMSMSSVKEDAVIVRSTIDLAHNLSIRVVAEGVEDTTTMDLLVDYGCDEAQGYLFSRPVSGAELTGWFESSPFGLPRRLPETAAIAV